MTITKKVIQSVFDDIFFEYTAPKMKMNIINKFDLTIDDLYCENMIAVNESFDYDLENNKETFAHVVVRIVDNIRFIVKMVRDFDTRELVKIEVFESMRTLLSSI